MQATLSKSDNPKKKYKVVITDNNKKKTIHFGAKGYEQYTEMPDREGHKDEERKNRYIDRHKKNENWNNIKTAGWWSLFLLWWKPTYKEAIKYIEKHNDIKIKNEI